MEVNNHQKEAENVFLSSIKFTYKECLEVNESLSYYQKMLLDINFYFLRENIKESIMDEIDEIFSDKFAEFSTFCFNIYENQKYITICFEHYCFSIEIEGKQSLIYVERILKYLSNSNSHIISPKKDDYQNLMALKEKINIKIESFQFPNEKEQEEIEIEVNQFVKSIEPKVFEILIFNISKECLSTYFIRRFYFKTKYFRDQNFFKTKYNGELIEFDKNEFIILRDISQNISLAFSKERIQLFVIKYKEENVSIEKFQRDKKLYCKINELNNFVKCFGYIKNSDNQITSLIIEFMSGGTIENYILHKKKERIDKYLLSFQILEGLDLLHSKNIIHRDLKPDNIFINHDLKIFIGDFESSRIVTNSNTILTKDIGSLIYASPEMINSEEYNASTDIYSFGLILYFIFTEERPYKLSNELDIINLKNDKNYHQNQVKIEDYFIKKIYSKCLIYNSNERPTTDRIIDEFIKISYEQFKKDNYKLLFYLYMNNNPKIMQKFIQIYNNIILDINSIKKNILTIILNKIPINVAHDKYKLSTSIIKFVINLANQNNQIAENLLKEFFIRKCIFKGGLKESIKYLISFANKNNSSAQYLVGKLYFKGKYLRMNIKKSLNYLYLSANQNNYASILYLAFIYYEGKYVTRDISKSIHFNTIIANKNNPEAQFNLGLIYYTDDSVRDINKAIYYLTLSANQNSPSAQLYLGLIYSEDQYIKPNISKAIFYLTLSANQNHFTAQYFLGVIYSNNKFNVLDINKSIYYFTLAANGNYQNAQFYLGLIYYENEFNMLNIDKSIYYFTLAANQKHMYAQFYLGFIFYEGKHIERNINKAIYYLTLSANQNFPIAQYLLGEIYYEGNYIKRDINKAIYYLTLSSDQNYPNAQNMLGKMNLEGRYLPQNINKGIQYLICSANQNFSMAQNNLGMINYEGIYVQRDITKAIYYLSLSANQNIPESQYNLGMIFLEGKYIKRNINKAIHYLTLSANNNYFQAQYILGKTYFEGIHLKRDISLSLYYLKKTANQNHDNSQYILGILYYKLKNIDKSIHYLTLSANQNNSNALNLLGNIYYEDILVKKDIRKSIYYYTLAAKLNNSIAQLNLSKIYFKEPSYVNINKGLMYLEKSSDQNNKVAQFLIGFINYKAILVPQNINKSIKYLALSAQQNLCEAQYFLGELYYTNEYIPRDIKKAIFYFKEASCFNSSKAKNILGIIYKNGEGVEKNIYASIEYFEEAIKKDQYEVSIHNLSRIYYFGIDVNEDHSKAIEILEKSKVYCLHIYLFFFFIYIFQKSNEKIEFYYQKIIENNPFLTDFLFNFIDLFINDSDEIEFQNFVKKLILNFLKDFDLFEYNKNNFFMELTKYIDESNNQYLPIVKKDICSFSKCKNIDNQFYEGFGYDLLKKF